jgi:hypothetical protein
MIYKSPIHKSDIKKYKRCPKQFQLENILGFKQSAINESALAGIAWHGIIHKIHKHYGNYVWDEEKDIKLWFETWVEDFRKLKEFNLKQGIEINTVEDIKAEKYLEMLYGYMSKPYNKYGQVVLSETEFAFEIKKGRTLYNFSGRIDQLIKIKIEHLPANFVIDKDYDRHFIYVHRDIKTGKKGGISKYVFEMNDDINVYAYALAYGLFDVDNDGICEKDIHHIPYYHALYYAQDHIVYKKKSGEHKAGDEHGYGMYPIKKSLNDLKYLREELILQWRTVNSGNYPRVGMLHDACDRYCGVRDICFKQLKGEL